MIFSISLANDEYRKQYYKIVEENTDWKVRNRKLCELQMNSEKYFIFDLQDNEMCIRDSW